MRSLLTHIYDEKTFEFLFSFFGSEGDPPHSNMTSSQTQKNLHLIHTPEQYFISLARYDYGGEDKQTNYKKKQQKKPKG